MRGGRTIGPDGLGLRFVKVLARAVFFAVVWMRRRWRRIRREERWTLGGECRRCAACCERPSIQVDALTWYFRQTFRRAFLWWQFHVNGFELVATEKPRTFVFQCLHFDPVTRLCDSYASRPGVCRDYPRVLLEQPWPEMFERCGYRPISKDGGRMLVALNTAPLTEEQREKLKRGLRLE